MTEVVQVPPTLLFWALAVIIFCTLLVFAMLLERLFKWASKRRAERRVRLNLEAFRAMQGQSKCSCKEPQDPREVFQEYMPWEE